MATLPPPLNISPLIRFGRWSALIAGVTWGISRHRSISKKENAHRDREAKLKPMRDAKAAEEKKRLVREELLYMAKETGTPVKEDFYEKY